jgi:hypothetical protein
MPGKRYPAGFLNYPGDCVHIVGEVKGPTTYGSHLMAVGAAYDETTDSTRVGFVYARPEDVESCVRDEFGILRVPSIEPEKIA